MFQKACISNTSSVFLFSFLSFYVFKKCLKAWANHNYGQGLGSQFSGPGPNNCPMSPSSLLPHGMGTTIFCFVVFLFMVKELKPSISFKATFKTDVQAKKKKKSQ